jgi:hypothetical protein
MDIELAVLQERERLLVVKPVVENDDGTRFVEDHAGTQYNRRPTASPTAASR